MSDFNNVTRVKLDVSAWNQERYFGFGMPLQGQPLWTDQSKVYFHGT